MTIRIRENNFSSIKYLTQSQFVRYIYSGEIILSTPTDQEITTKFKPGVLHITIEIP